MIRQRKYLRASLIHFVLAGLTIWLCGCTVEPTRWYILRAPVIIKVMNPILLKEERYKYTNPQDVRGFARVTKRILYVPYENGPLPNF